MKWKKKLSEALFCVEMNFKMFFIVHDDGKSLKTTNVAVNFSFFVEKESVVLLNLIEKKTLISRAKFQKLLNDF